MGSEQTTATAPSNDAVERKRVRRHDLDWVRVLTVLSLIPFHTARIFNYNYDEGGTAEPFYVKSQALSDPLSYFVNFLYPWQMPLLFVVAGATSWFALGFRSGGQYANERLKRLLIPLVFGVLVIVPPHVYIAAISNGGFHGNFFSFWPDFFRLGEDLNGWNGTFTFSHLWFILYLLVFSMIGLAPFLYLRRRSGARLLSWLAALSLRPGVILLFAVPLFITDYLARDVGRFFLLFLLGYVVVADGRFGAAIDRHKRVALALGIIATAVLNAVWRSHVDLSEDTPQSLGFRFLYQLDGWFWIVAIIGYGHRFLGVDNQVLRYANEAAYPFYILHNTVIVIIGFYVLKLRMDVSASFTFIALASLVATLGFYDLFVKRIGMLRFLFGMK